MTLGFKVQTKLDCGILRPMSETACVSSEVRPAPWGLYLAALILAFAGVVLCSLILAQLGIPAATSAQQGFMCGGDGQGCARVYNSPQSTFLGLPAATWGLTYFFGALVYLLAAGRRAVAHWFTYIPLALGGLYSVWMLLQLALMREFCGWCVITHIVNFLMIVALVAHAMATGRHDLPNVWRIRLVGMVLAVSLPLTFGLGMATSGQIIQQLNRQREIMNDQVMRLLIDEDLQAIRFKKNPVQNIPADEDDAILGPAEATVRITVFKDFQCPHCRELSDRLKKVQARFPKDVCVVFKHYPQDTPCNPHRRELAKTNPLYENSVHPMACEISLAAEAVRLARGSKAFWEYHDLLFANQNKIQMNKALLRDLAVQVGVKPEKFDEMMKNDQKLREKINRDCLLYQKIVPQDDFGMGGIPRVYLNGRFFDAGWKTPNEFMERTIQTMLTGGSAATQPSFAPAYSQPGI